MSQSGMEEINLKYFNNEYVDIKGNKYEVTPITAEVIYEGDDHEVSMAMGQLDDIIKNVTELKGKIGTQEINLPGWIQDHISQSQNFINQANTGYHELKK
jgi:CYTH domain-containing protein